MGDKSVRGGEPGPEEEWQGTKGGVLVLGGVGGKGGGV